MEIEKPNYWANIPANVRYDNSLKPMEKLLYAEITALLNKKGYCFASNAYFARLYECDKTTVSRWISNLQKKGYIKVVLNRDSKNTVLDRKIFCVNLTLKIEVEDTPIDEKINTPIDEKINTPIDEKVKDINTREYQYKRISKNLKNCASHDSFKIPNPKSVFEYWEQEQLTVSPVEFFNYQQKKKWKLPNGDLIKNWRYIYKKMSEDNPDFYAVHNPELKFNIQDYNTGD